jgi:hypothetical protein
MLRRLLALVVAVVVASCSSADGGTTPTRIDADGSWAGTFPAQGGAQDVTLTLNLAETDGAVTGDGTLITAADTFALTLAGTYDSPRLSLEMKTADFDPVSLVALVGEESMTGTIGGGGFNNENFTLDRQ